MRYDKVVKAPFCVRFGVFLAFLLGISIALSSNAIFFYYHVFLFTKYGKGCDRCNVFLLPRVLGNTSCGKPLKIVDQWFFEFSLFFTFLGFIAILIKISLFWLCFIPEWKVAT